MKTMLIPVDFTDTSNNAVDFAAHWSQKYQYTRIILLKTFYDSMFENMMIAAEYSRVNDDFGAEQCEEAHEQMNILKQDLIAKTGSGIEVETLFSELPLLRAIIQVIEEENAELVVLGSDNKNYSSGSFIAGNLIDIAKASPVRVLIVPAECRYHPVHNALIPFDFTLASTLNTLSHLKKMAQWKDIRLMVLNIDPKQRYLQPDEKFSETEAVLHKELEDFPHELYYDNDKNIINGIMNFARNNPVDLIIAMPGNRSFLYYLTHKSISQAIYQNARQPVLILK